MAPADGIERVMFSASTARLVDGTAALGEGELVGSGPISPSRLSGCWAWRNGIALIERVESNLVGRRWEMSPLEAC
jgi:hypothetical protein